MKIKEEKKTFIVSSETHSLVKEYCESNGLKMNNWVEKQLLLIIEKANKKD